MILPQQMTQKVLAEQWKQGVQIMYRNQTKEVRIGDVVIGGDHPIAIQSMTNTRTEDVEATVEQILRLEKAGCEIIRCTVPTMEAAKAIKEIKKQIHIPLVADIHFDYKMAIAAIENGADKIRINPGNIGAKERVQAVVDKAKEYNVPIRVGVNSGSLEKHLLEKYGGVTAEGIVESALDKVHLIESMGYDNLVVSIKSSDVLMCVKAHELIAKECPYPLHVGITESGTVYSGNVKSSVGLGIILHEGIGNTIRVSLKGKYLYNTNYVIWDNIGLEKKDGNIAAYQIMADVFDRLDIHTGTIFNYHQQRRQTKNYLADLELLQYDIMYGKQYVYKDSGAPITEGHMVMGVKDATITSVVEQLKGTYSIYGENFTKQSKVYINGEKQTTKFLNNTRLDLKESEIKDGDQIMVAQCGSSNTIFRTSKTYEYTGGQLVEVTDQDTDVENRRQAFVEQKEEKKK